MCTWIIEKAEMYGSGKGAGGWFRMNQAMILLKMRSSAGS